MAKRGTKSGIGIELTGDRINIVKLTKTSKGVFLAEARSIKISTGKKDDKKLLVSNITKAFERLDFTKDEISLGVGGHMSFVRKVKLPPVSKTKLKQVISFEVQQQVPFSLNEVIWDYQIISSISKIPGPVVVLIAAIKQSFVDDLLKILQGSINKIPDVVDISSLALHNCLIFNELLPKEKVGILVNLGFSYTDVSIENKGEMAFTRAVPIGKKNLLKKIADSRKVETEQAEKILESEDVSSIILPVWEDLVAEIKRTTNYYLSQVEKVTQFQYIYLAGEFPKNSNFPSLLKNSFRAEIKEVDPLKKIGYDPAQLPASLPSAGAGGTDGASNLCVSTGLALRAMAHFPVEINLLPPRILGKRELASKRLYFISSFVVFFLIGWILVVSGTRNYNLTNEKINMIESILKNYKPYVTKVEELKSKRQEITSKLQNIEQILKQKSQLSGVLIEISKLTPSDIYITEIYTTIPASETEGATRGATRGEVSPRQVPAITRRSDEGRASPRAMGGSMTGGFQGIPGMSPGLEARRAVSGEQSQVTEVNKGTLRDRISLIGITASYPTVDEYIKQLKTSPLFKTVELVSALSVLEGRQGMTTQPLSTGPRGRTPSRNIAERNISVGDRGERIIQEENVQFILEIMLDLSRRNVGTDLGQ